MADSDSQPEPSPTPEQQAVEPSQPDASKDTRRRQHASRDGSSGDGAGSSRSSVYVMGEIRGAQYFPNHHKLYCKWRVGTGDRSAWKRKAGILGGQTHRSTAANGDDPRWDHPIDLHFTTKGIQDWPKLYIQVWNEDCYGRQELISYGNVELPKSPGMHDLVCHTWQPQGSITEHYTLKFIGGGPQLSRGSLTYDNAEWYKINANSMGCVHVQLGVILHGFNRFHMEC